MIRIDLGKDEIKKNAPGKNKLNLKLPPKVQVVLDDLLSNVGGLVMLGVALALAFLPKLVLEEYKKIAVKQHQEQMSDINARTQVAAAEVAKLTPFQKELESYELQKKLVNERIEVIRQLLAQRGTPVNVLDAIGQSLPPRAWLNNIDIAAAGPSITLSGQAISNEEISDFVDRLSESVHLSDVSLDDVGSSKGSGGNIEIKSFGITARSRAQMQPAPIAAPADAAPGAVPGAPAGVPGQAPQGGT